MAFIANTQEELKALQIVAGNTYDIEYVNKDYFNGEETMEKGKGTAMLSDGKIYFSVVDPYGMDKMVMQVRIISN